LLQQQEPAVIGHHLPQVAEICVLSTTRRGKQQAHPPIG
jgi:hypothetical protein